jgi:hypothetical protein
VLDGRCLFGVLYGVKLGAEAGGLLAVSGDLAVQPGAQGFFAVQGIGGGGGLALGGGERGLGLGDFGRQGARGKGEAGTLQIDALQLYEVFNVRLHPCYEVYGICRLLRKWGGGILRQWEAIGRRIRWRLGHRYGAGTRGLCGWAAGC